MSDTVLMNFHIPRHLKSRFDRMCDFRNLTRTHVILTSIEPVIENWETKYQNRPRPTLQSEMDVLDDGPIGFVTSNEVFRDF